MKKILITGSSGYIGSSFIEYIKGNDDICVETISLRDEKWKNKDFSQYDSILHLAGIAHSDNGKLTEKQKDNYYKVNTDLTLEVAQKAINDGVAQFIYMSSIIIFGESAPMGKTKVIDESTKPNPKNAYGDSKLQAEIKLEKLSSNMFKVAIVRPPMVYGKNSKGNYPVLSKFAKITPIFPDIKNERSMIYIENLCELITLLIKNEGQGIFMPQNEVYTNTSQMVKIIAKTQRKKIILTKIFNFPVKILSGVVGIINKVFGNLVYDMKISEYKENYCVVEFEESIERTERI